MQRSLSAVSRELSHHLKCCVFNIKLRQCITEASYGRFYILSNALSYFQQHWLQSTRCKEDSLCWSKLICKVSPAATLLSVHPVLELHRPVSDLLPSAVPVLSQHTLSEALSDCLVRYTMEQKKLLCRGTALGSQLLTGNRLHRWVVNLNKGNLIHSPTLKQKWYHRVGGQWWQRISN